MDTNQRSVDAYIATELILDRLRLLQYLNLAIGGHHVDALAQVPILCGFFARSPSQSLELDVLCSHNYLCVFVDYCANAIVLALFSCDITLSPMLFRSGILPLICCCKSSGIGSGCGV